MKNDEEHGAEHLATVRFKDGSGIKFSREGTTLHIEGSDIQVSLPRATGQQAVSLLSLLEGLGESVEFPDDEEDT